jgi:curved DNA-binding protein CbpA
MNEYYALLGVAPDASAPAIGKAYRRLAKTCHPDLHANDPALVQRFIRISEAYSTLSDPEARRDYDMRNAPSTANDNLANWPPMPKQPRHYTIDELAAFYAASYKMASSEKSHDLIDLALAILRSPITYCLLVVFLFLCGIKELTGGFAHPHH